MVRVPEPAPALRTAPSLSGAGSERAGAVAGAGGPDDCIVRIPCELRGMGPGRALGSLTSHLHRPASGLVEDFGANVWLPTASRVLTVRCRHRLTWERKQLGGDTMRRQHLHELCTELEAFGRVPGCPRTGGGPWARSPGYVGTPGISLTQDHLLTGLCTQQSLASSLYCPSGAWTEKGAGVGPALLTMGTLGITSSPARSHPFHFLSPCSKSKALMVQLQNDMRGQ